MIRAKRLSGSLALIYLTVITIAMLSGCITTTGEVIKDKIVGKIAETRREINEKAIRASSKGADSAIKFEKHMYCGPIRGDVILDNFCPDKTCEKWVSECRREGPERIKIRVE